MSASTGPVNFSSAGHAGHVVHGDDGAKHGRQVQDRSRARTFSCSSVIGPSVAPKNTVWFRSWRMPPPDPIDW